MNPYELIAEADKEEVNQIRMRDRKIKDRMIISDVTWWIRD